MAVSEDLVIKLGNDYFEYVNQEMCTIVLNYAQGNSDRCAHRSRNIASVRQRWFTLSFWSWSAGQSETYLRMSNM